MGEGTASFYMTGGWRAPSEKKGVVFRKKSGKKILVDYFNTFS